MNLPVSVVPFKELQFGYIWCTLICAFITLESVAQEVPLDSLQPIPLSEVVLISAEKKLNYQKQHKPLSSLDEFLESARNISMIKRGAYAWEPSMNDMQSERLAVTIDGMQIFGACTDKMDPVTSYVDVSNLKQVEIQSGQQGAEFGHTIGGGINLRTDQGDFSKSGWKGSIESAFESNNQLQVFGGELNYSNEKFYLKTDGIYRSASNYKAGGDEEVKFSQFNKYNFSLNSGYILSDDRSFSATLIYDEANDVGYPALPMDVSLARAVIGSFTYRQDSFLKDFNNWETKVYYNHIRHVMDDTKRPDVAIHMDMPGWSETCGYYSQAELKMLNHQVLLKLDGYLNRSLAEMTMYPSNSNEPPMFMLTWPDVRTADLGFYAEDQIKLDEDWVKLSARMGYHSNTVADEFGLRSLMIFYPEMEKSIARFLKSISALYHKILNKFSVDGVLSYGERAASVSEGYGFYLFNSFDNHDYIGNPDLNTENSLEANLELTYKIPGLEITAGSRYFHVFNYIIGIPDSSLSTMTIGADGVKIYSNLKYARLFNSSLRANYHLTDNLTLNSLFSYHRGIDNEGENLPLISPLNYQGSLEYSKKQFSASLTVEGAAAQVNYNPTYGETRSAAYTILSGSFGKRFFISNNDFFVKAGVENIFDSNYSTYSDWKNIPRMGRNIYLTITYAIN